MAIKTRTPKVDHDRLSPGPIEIRRLDELIPASVNDKIKVALTGEQVREMDLPAAMKAKVGSSRSKGFVREHGENVFELEALPPERLQSLIRAAIESVLDMDAFQQEEARERDDAVELEGLRQRARMALADNIG